ncbi:MAG: beta-glucosidase, partial [Acidobacteria bacterium 37-65-4]
PHDVFQSAIIAGVKDGRISPAVLDSAVARVLRVKFLLGLFDHPYIDVNLDKRVCRSPEHLELALEVARQSMCLLKNQDSLLPLKKGLKCIAVIGPNADSTRLGDYSSKPEDRTEEGMLGQIKRMVSPGTRVLFSDGSDINEAIAQAKHAQVVILALGENSRISGENRDRSELDLPGNQEELLESVVQTGTPAVLVLQNGRPLAIPWAAEHVPAILEAWYPGEFGGRAIAETLFGDNNPAGRLTVSFPRRVGQLPVYYNHGPSKMSKYIDGDDAPQFVFGYGLSYTTFKYDNLSVVPPPAGSGGDVLVSFDLTNTGSRDGDEVAQLYVREKTASVETPVKALKAFTRVHLRSGETRLMTLHVKQADLAVWGADKKWEVEPGEFTVTVGGSSAKGESANFTLK